MDDKSLVSAWGYRHAHYILQGNGTLPGDSVGAIKTVQVPITEHDDSGIGLVLSVELCDVAGVEPFGVSVQTLVGSHLECNDDGQM